MKPAFFMGLLPLALILSAAAPAAATSLASLLPAAGCPALPSWAALAFVPPEANAQIAVRYRTDGTTPSASVGEPILGWQAWPEKSFAAASNVAPISATGASGTVGNEIRG